MMATALKAADTGTPGVVALNFEHDATKDWKPRAFRLSEGFT